jgi:hypothetical protein
MAPTQRISVQESPRNSLAPQPNELRCKETLKKAVAAIRSKEKTRQLMELCGQVTRKVQKSDAWFANYEKFFRSPVWKLVSDEAIRKAHFKCEYWRCTCRATQVYLLELPEEHLKPNFDWMNRGNILMALCSHHHQIIHGFVMTRVVPANQPRVSPLNNCDPDVLAGFTPCSVGSHPAAGNLRAS